MTAKWVEGFAWGAATVYVLWLAALYLAVLA